MLQAKHTHTHTIHTVLHSRRGLLFSGASSALRMTCFHSSWLWGGWRHPQPCHSWNRRCLSRKTNGLNTPVCEWPLDAPVVETWDVYCLSGNLASTLSSCGHSWSVFPVFLEMFVMMESRFGNLDNVACPPACRPSIDYCLNVALEEDTYIGSLNLQVDLQEIIGGVSSVFWEPSEGCPQLWSIQNGGDLVQFGDLVFEHSFRHAARASAVHWSPWWIRPRLLIGGSWDMENDPCLWQCHESWLSNGWEMSCCVLQIPNISI